MSSKKIPIPVDRFIVEEETPLYKRASGVVTQKVEKKEVKPPKKSKHIVEEDLTPYSFRLHPKQIKELNILYAETRVNVSKIIRDALELYLSDFLKDKTLNKLNLSDTKMPDNTFETKGIRLTHRLYEAVGVVAAINAVDRSVIVRNAIDKYIAENDAK